MADRDQSWDLEHLGDTIQEIIDQAVSSNDFQKLNQNVRQTVNTAIDAGADALRRAQFRQQSIQDQQRLRQAEAQARAAEAYRRNQERIRQRHAGYTQTRIPGFEADGARVTVEAKGSGIPNPGKFKPLLYGSTTGRTLGGIFLSIGGGILSAGAGFSLLFSGLMASLGIDPASAMITPAITLLFGGTLLTLGVHTIARMNRFDKYIKVLGDKSYCSIQLLAQKVGKSVGFVRKELEKMISQRLFLEGHIDLEGKTLITSDETYAHYQETLAQQEEKKALEAQKAKREKLLAADKAAKAIPPQVQEVLDLGNAYIAEIKRCNSLIPGEEITDKISRMELIVQRIFERAENHPEVVPDLKKLMDYYLPMTVKLLNAYAEMDAQPIQGDTIQASKREIEATLDTLNQAFERLLDSIFKETAMDVSSDISVLQTLLAQEGLTDDELTKLRKGQV